MPALSLMPGITIGADPELFVFDPEGRPVTAAGLIPGTKEEPYKVPHGAVQVDGMAAEFNIDPVTTFGEFDRNIRRVRAALKDMLPAGYNLKSVPSVTFDEKAWEEAPDEAKALGCSPDYNAWTGKVNPPPRDPDNPTMRCAGGHIHIGWTKDADPRDETHANNCRDLVKQLDWYLGSWQVSVDEDTNRRRLYGKAGSMRIKDYGVEYRTLSNHWLGSEGTRRVLWNRMCVAIDDMRQGFVPEIADAKGRDSGFDFNGALVRGINESSITDGALVSTFARPILFI